MISLVLSDEGLINRKLTVRSLIDGRSILWCHFSQPTKFNLSPISHSNTLYGQQFIGQTFSYYNLQNLKPQSGHPGPGELEPSPEEDLWDERTKLGLTDSAWHRWSYPVCWWHLPEGSLCWCSAWHWSYSPELRRYLDGWYSTTWTGLRLRTAGGGALTHPTLYLTCGRRFIGGCSQSPAQSAIG